MPARPRSRRTRNHPCRGAYISAMKPLLAAAPPDSLVNPSAPPLSGESVLPPADFKLVSPFAPAGDQPQAITELTAGLQRGEKDQVLLGVTGSGKTFTMAHVIQNLQRPTLILAPNKTLAAQLYGEMKSFFPENAVEYFVSYYDY